MADSISSTSSATSSSAQSSTSARLSLFQASGLASGLNTGLIVDALIAADSVQLNALKRRQADYQVQISTLGTLVSQLQDLQTAASNLATNGVVSIQPKSTYADFSTTGSAKAEGSYAIRVDQLAKEAKMRSAMFTSAQDAGLVSDGTLKFNIDGTDTAAIDTTGKTLADVAEAINQRISGLTASIVHADDGYYLNVARSSTGYSTSAQAALTVVSGAGLDLTSQQTAQNASLTVDGLQVSRQTNSISDVIPGITLGLTGNSGTSQNVRFVADSSGTETVLNGFVDAYNALAKTLNTQLVTDPTQQYGDTLLSHSTTGTIESALQGMLSKTVVASGSVRTLADLGLEIQRDGTLSINSITLAKAVQSSPSAVNAIFSTATTGIAATVKSLVKSQADTVHGTLVLQQSSLESSISDMTDQEASMQDYLDAERARLVAEFTSMETLISGYNAATSYLTQIANLSVQK